MKVSLYTHLWQLRFYVKSTLVTDIRRWQSYVEPGDEIETGSPTKRISRNNLEPLNGKRKLKKKKNDFTENFLIFFFLS